MTDQPTRSIPATPAEFEDGRFVTGDVLGIGGMAIVVSARDTLLDRTVAVKLLADSLAYDVDARERFSREARSMAALNHPNVVQVYDVGEADERPYFIMEYVPNGSLADRLRTGGPLPPDEVDRVAVEALRGLAHAHAAGLLHRDLKPGNLLVGVDGIVKVTDFGVARAAESQSLTRTGIVLGTMRYLAPERLRGQTSTEASDLYGLAATLFELLTAAGVDAKKDPQPLRRLPQETPATLRTFLQRALAEDPLARPASAAAALAIWNGDADERTGRLPPLGTATSTIPVDQEAPTRAHDTPSSDGSGAAASPSGPTDRWVGARARQLSTRGRRRLLVAFVVLALLVALAAVSEPAGRTGGSAPGDDVADRESAEGPGTAGGAGVPRGDTPEETARNLAQWIRDLGK